MKVSLVTTVLNDREGVEHFFRAMRSQTLPPDEIVVVDAGSTDGTYELLLEEASKRPDLIVMQEVRCNVARGRNLAIERATHEIILSTDIGCEWEPKWAEELVRPLLDDSSTEAVMGSWAVDETSLENEWAIIEFCIGKGMRFEANEKSHASSRAIAYRKSLWKRMGGYPEDLSLAADDMTFALLLHQTTQAVKAAPVPRCFWSRLGSLKAYLKEARRNFKGAGEAGIWRKHFCVVTGKLFVEWISLILGVFLAGRIPWLGWPLFGLGMGLLGWRWFKLRSAIQMADDRGVENATVKCLFFDIALKLYGAWGYSEGWRRGNLHCQECRRRLKDAGVQH